MLISAPGGGINVRVNWGCDASDQVGRRHSAETSF
jgi:hypothetical protein